jgi:hypothetical protein
MLCVSRQASDSGIEERWDLPKGLAAKRIHGDNDGDT